MFSSLESTALTNPSYPTTCFANRAGYDRPAVGRSAFLETKLNWIGAQVHDTANHIETAIAKDDAKVALLTDWMHATH